MATLTATRQSDQLQMQTQTGRTGEYDLKLPDGTWDLRVAVPGLRGELAFPGVVMAGQNVKLDFTATNLTPWRNLANPLDVDNDGHIWPLDAMKIINKLNEPGAGPLSESPWPPVVPPPYVDVSGDNYLAPIDALLVINELNREASGEGESRFGGLGGVLSAEAVWFPSDGSCSDAFRELASGPDSLGGFGGMYPAGFPHSDTCEEVAESLVEVNRSARSGEITRQATDAFCALLGGNETDEWDELLPLADEWSTR
jgi:hypothetical protein